MGGNIICVGTAIVDIPLYPVTENDLHDISHPLEDISMKVGGDALNESIIISRLGNKVSLLSAVGSDAPGYFIKGTAKKNGVNTEYLNINPKLKTSINIGMTRPNGDRTFFTNKNGSLWKMSINDIDISAINDAKILSFASIFNNPLFKEDEIRKIFISAKQKGMIICADIVKSRNGESLNDIKSCLSYIDYFFPNYDEAFELTGESDVSKQADIFLNLGVKNIVIKTGKKGCFIKNNTISKSIPAYKLPVGTPLDTTGAGDNFAAGFISKLNEGGNFEECAKFGTAVAAISVTGLGATASVKSKKQVEDFMQIIKQ